MDPEFRISPYPCSKKAVKNRDSSALQQALDSLGTTLETSTGKDRVAIDLDMLSLNLEPSLEILADMVMNPVFKQEAIDLEKSRRLQKIGQENTSPRSIIRRELPYLLYNEQHPYATPGTGTGDTETLSAINGEVINRYYTDWIRPDNATLVVAGDAQLEALLPILEKTFGQWQAPTTPVPSLAYPAVAKPSKARVFLMDQPDAQQSTIAVAQLLPSLSADNLDEELSFEVFNDLLGGEFTSRINMNLREEKRWTYGARSYSRDARGQRPYLISTSVQTDKTGPALDEVRKELGLVFGQEPATTEEVAKYRGNRQKEQAGRYETNARLLSAISRVVTYDLPDNYLQQYPELLKVVDTESVREAGASLIDPATMTWVIVGDLEKIEEEVRALGLGEVEIVKPRG